jgi:membrane protein
MSRHSLPHQRFARLKTRVEGFYGTANRRSGGVLGVFVTAIQRFGTVRGAEAAASMAYYALFSLFPLLLVLTAVLGFVLVRAEAPGQVLDFFSAAVPVQRGLIEDNLLQILEARGASLTSGVAVLLWSASSFFLVLTRNVNRAWPEAPIRNIIQGRIMAIIMVASLSILLVLSVFLSAGFRVLASFQIPIRGSVSIYETPLWQILVAVLPWVVVFLIIILIYFWLPNTRVLWREAFWGALFSALALSASGWIFTWLLRGGWVRFEVVYGSLAAILILLTWIYVSSFIILFGAHISSAIAHATRLKPQIKEDVLPK